MSLQKHYIAKMYDNGGNFLKTLNTKEIQNFPPKFTESMNGGLGQLVIDLRGDDWKFDDFGDGTTVKHFNYIEVYAVKVNTTTLAQTETLIYGGFLTRYEAYIDSESNEGVKLTFLGWVSILTRAYYMSGASYTVTETTLDPAEILQDIIDHFNSVFGGSHLSYGANVSTVGTDVTIVFTDKKHIDAVKQTAAVAPTDWWWKIAANGELYFKDKPGSITHRFAMGKDVIDVSVTKDAEKVINDVQVRYTGAGTYDASDAVVSQPLYGFGSPATGKHSKIISESGLNAAAATLRGDKEVEDNKMAKTAVVATIGNEYDIESIHAGETAAFVNFDDTNPIFNTSMLITKVDYQGDFVRVYMERTIGDFTLEMGDLVG